MDKWKSLYSYNVTKYSIVHASTLELLTEVNYFKMIGIMLPLKSLIISMADYQTLSVFLRYVLKF